MEDNEPMLLKDQMQNGSTTERDVPPLTVPNHPTIDPEIHPVSPRDSSPQVRRSTRERRPPATFNYDQLGVPDTNSSKYMAYLVTAEDRLTYRQATNGEEKDHWEEAIKKEFDSLAENKVWTLETLPKGRKAIGCKWVFKKKDVPGGSIRYRARLVAKGYAQVAGLDFTDTFAPVLKYQSL